MLQSNTTQDINLSAIDVQIKNSFKSSPEQLVAPAKTKMCETCGSIFLIPSGTCYVCQNCGTSEGCS